MTISVSVVNPHTDKEVAIVILGDDGVIKSCDTIAPCRSGTYFAYDDHHIGVYEFPVGQVPALEDWNSNSMLTYKETIDKLRSALLNLIPLVQPGSEAAEVVVRALQETE